MKVTTVLVILLYKTFISVKAQHNPYHWENHSVIVQLFEWKWKDIAEECEQFLGPRGYGGVQISPPNENVIVSDRPWWERYQPISYKIITRSGNSDEFIDMSKRCNKVGVRIYADILLNHMAADHDVTIGTGGSHADPHLLDFPAVPYTAVDFNPPCSIQNYNDPYQVRNCELVGLHDLNQGVRWVRDRMVDYLNNLVDLGVAGFRVDAAKHMWPVDLNQIFNSVNNLNADFGFPAESRPFIYQEVIDLGGEGVSKYEYIDIGLVTEFKFSMEIGRAFQRQNPLFYLKTWGEKWGFLPTNCSLVFVDNHDNQRSGRPNILTYKTPKEYKMAIAFMLSHTFGVPRIISSFGFDNTDQGPPQDKNGNIISPTFNQNNTCNNGWICEHRWRQLYNMVEFKNVVKGTEISNWWDNGNNQIAFCRNGRGFIAFNLENHNMNITLNTCLPKGEYCDIISGSKANGKCSGLTIKVDDEKKAVFNILENGEDGVIAIHIDSRL